MGWPPRPWPVPPVSSQRSVPAKAVSKHQFRLFQAAAHGRAKIPGMDAAAAAEYIRGQSPANLPERHARAAAQAHARHKKRKKR